MSKYLEKNVYIVGAGLTYIGIFIYNIIPVDANWSARIIWAIVLGSIEWVILLVPLFLLQWLVGKAISTRLVMTVPKRVFIINLPIIVLTAVVLIGQWKANSPQIMFEKLVMTPVPKSLSNLQMKGVRRMDSALWVFCFRITSVDLGILGAIKIIV